MLWESMSWKNDIDFMDHVVYVPHYCSVVGLYHEVRGALTNATLLE